MAGEGRWCRSMLGRQRVTGGAGMWAWPRTLPSRHQGALEGSGAGKRLLKKKKNPIVLLNNWCFDSSTRGVTSPALVPRAERGKKIARHGGKSHSSGFKPQFFYVRCETPRVSHLTAPSLGLLLCVWVRCDRVAWDSCDSIVCGSAKKAPAQAPLGSRNE